MGKINGKNKAILIGTISGAFGGALGASSGVVNNWPLVAVISATLAALVAWGISGMFDKK
jgi:hypothetical protein